MLRITERTPQNDGYYLSGSYTLAIAEISDDGSINTNNVTYQNTFPIVTDIDTQLTFPNAVQPDQADGVYVELNEVGTGTISIRGHTGQFPEKGALDFLPGGLGVTASSIASAIPVDSIQGATGNRDGYQIFMALVNFFANWVSQINGYPGRRAMLFFNHKDVEFYQVVPLNFRKPRTSGAPMRYGYNVDLQILREVSYTPVVSWQDMMATSMAKVRGFQNAIDRSVLLASQIVSGFGSFGISAVFGTAQTSMANMAAGIENLKYSVDMISGYANSQLDLLKNPSEIAYASELDKAYTNKGQTMSQSHIPGGIMRTMLPPTRSVVADVFSDTFDIFQELETGISETGQVGGTKTEIALDDPVYSNYDTMLDFLATAYLAEDLAPLPDDSPAAGAGDESRNMHRNARLQSSYLIDGREDEFASSALAGDTHDISGTRTPKGDTGRSLAEHPLSYVASKLLNRWVRGKGTGVDAELEAFRRGFLGMSDPFTQSPLYRVVTVNITDSIYSLASRELGSWSRWPEIALINNLKYPYISQQGGLYQKAPGESIFVPFPDAKVPVELVENLTNIQETHDLVLLQDIFLGFDWAVDAISGDFVWGEYDQTMVAGIEAFEQEIGVVLEGSGGVTPDRFSLLPLRIGTKSRGISTTRLWQSIISNWLNGDYRVAEVRSVSVKNVGTRVAFSAKLKFEHYDTTTTLSGAVKS